MTEQRRGGPAPMNDLPGGPRNDDESGRDHEPVHDDPHPEDDQHTGKDLPDPPRPIAQSPGTTAGPASEHAGVGGHRLWQRRGVMSSTATGMTAGTVSRTSPMLQQSPPAPTTPAVASPAPTAPRSRPGSGS